MTDVPQPSSVRNWPSIYPVTGIVQVVNPDLKVFKSISVVATPIQIKAGATELWGWHSYNNAAAANERSLKFFNSVSAPVVGVTVPDMTLTIGGRSPAALMLPRQLPFKNGLWILATTASGDAATGAPGAGEVSANIFYI